MSRIVAGRFDRTVDADAALAALAREGFTDKDVDSFYVGPPGQHDMTRLDLLAHAPDGADGQDLRDADRLQRVDVCAIIDGARAESMAPSMPGQKRDPASFKLSKDQRPRRIAERRLDPRLPDLREPLHIIKPAAADDSDVGLFLARSAAPSHRAPAPMEERSV